MATSHELQSKLDHLPDQPGVYLFRDGQGELLYIGKAAALSSRVRSYFQKGADHSPKTAVLVSHISDLETIVTRSELEALILESNLIKRHRPRFNVVLRDDKQYPYLRLPIKEDFPRLSIVRRVQQDGALYYGPYTPAGALRETLKVIKKAFPLATCTILIDGKAERACIEFEIKRCMAPCTGNQSKEDYHHIVAQVRQFLEGRDHELLDDLRVQMEAAAEREDFEEAARLRDRLFNIERTLEKQRITQTTTTDQDVIGLARQGSAVDLQILFVRGGLLIGRKDFFWPHSADAGDEELVRSAIEQFYNKDGQPPKELLIPTDLDDATVIEEWLSGKRGNAVRVVAPERGVKHQLLLLAEENAAAAVANHLRDEEIGRQAIEELKRLRTAGYRASPYRRVRHFQHHGQSVCRLHGRMGRRSDEESRLPPLQDSNRDRRQRFRQHAGSRYATVQRQRESRASGSHPHRWRVRSARRGHGRAETGWPSGPGNYWSGQSTR